MFWPDYKNDIFCPPNCFELRPNEKDQRSLKGMPDAHRCQKYNIRVYHGSHHPQIMKCEACKKNKEETK